LGLCLFWVVTCTVRTSQDFLGLDFQIEECFGEWCCGKSVWEKWVGGDLS
jgi:hypothetical protein